MRFLRAFSIVIIIAFGIHACAEDASSESGNDNSASSGELERPNIVLILAEDMSSRVGYFGDPVARTPNIDKLASEGVAFFRTYTAAGVCAPSRAALIMGAHQQTFGAHQMRAKNEGYLTVPPASWRAFPELLRRAGYYVTNNSKTDYQMGNPFTIWDESNNKAHWRNRPLDKPFFHMVTFNVTHESFTWPGNAEPPSDATDTFKAIFARNSVRNGKLQAKQTGAVKPVDVVVPAWLPDVREVREDLARHYNNIESMDAMVGQTLAQLKADGLSDNTIVIWSTDHGDGLPRAKRSLYQSGTLVPLIVRFPDGHRAGEKSQELVSFVDFAPTLLSMAGVKPPNHMQGNVFLGKNRNTPRTYVYSAADRHDEIPDRVRAITDNQFKYMRNFVPETPLFQHLEYRDLQPSMRALWRGFEAGTLNDVQRRNFLPRQPEELYDLSVDPHELNNLAGNREYSETLARFRDELARFEAQYGDLGRLPESALKETMWPGGVQPETQVPESIVKDGLLYLHSATEGASIGYRFESDPLGLWRLYVGGIDINGGEPVSYKAVRYGFKESNVATVK